MGSSKLHSKNRIFTEPLKFRTVLPDLKSIKNSFCELIVGSAGPYETENTIEKEQNLFEMSP